ncbi:MAG: recombination protein RecR [Acidobacteria bacterium]|nr:recombination protein RecR [Acidobacteriota bacterium]
MKEFAQPIARLVDELKRLPGVGQKTAQRLAFHILRQPTEEALRLADAIRDAKQTVRACSVCNNITDQDPCAFCSSPTRNRKLICVVEEPHDIVNIEKTRQFGGLYHVLGGVIAPLQGVGPEQLKVKGLLERLQNGTVDEIIIATNPNAEGEATALYLSRLIKPLGIKVTRIAMGIPVGSDLEYADEVTLQRALEGRREL